MKKTLYLSSMVLTFALFGCGGGERIVQVNGTVLYKGAPLKSGDGVDIQVVFVGKNKEGETQVYTGSVNRDSGVFVMHGIRDGIPPGDYKVTVNYASLQGNFDFLAGQAALQLRVPDEGKQEVVIDLDKKQIARKG